MKSRFFIIVSFAFLISSCCGIDENRFKGTKAECLAVAVAHNDIPKVFKILRKESTIVNFQESQNGYSVLYDAIQYGNPDVVLALLDFGADPNIYDHYPERHGTPLIYACEFSSPKILELLLKAGGDPNKYEMVINKENQGYFLYPRSPLYYACQNSYDKVRLLLDYGATEDLCRPNYLAVQEAITQGNMDITFLLLHILEENGKLEEVNKEINICECLRSSICDPYGIQYKYKRQIIVWLKERGMDYSETPIHPFVLNRIKRKYPNNWEDVLEIY